MLAIANPAEYDPLIDPGLDIELFQQQFCQLIGIPESIPVALAIKEIIGGLIPFTPENQEPINYVLAFVAAQKPSSLLEAQLFVQLLATHRLCTQMLKNAADERWPENIEKYVNIAAKLSRGYTKGLESLLKYRRDGKQYFYIEHVHVEKGAQAVIGNVSRGDD